MRRKRGRERRKGRSEYKEDVGVRGSGRRRKGRVEGERKAAMRRKVKGVLKRERIFFPWNFHVSHQLLLP